MLEQLSRQLKNAALHFQRRGIFGLKAFGHVVISAPGVDLGSASVNIYGSEVVFGPGMDGQVRLGNHDHAGNAVRIERMEDHVHNVGMRVLGGIDHDGFDFMHVVKNF